LQQRESVIASSFTIHGVPLTCQHCRGTQFNHRNAQLNTAWMTFFDLDWMNAYAEVYACATCGHLHWFLGSEGHRQHPDQNSDDAAEPSRCMQCGAVILLGHNRCSKCGHMYASLRSD
jgi:DNA-directed RNA polymerase subunit RPC12/RpoP